MQNSTQNLRSVQDVKENYFVKEGCEPKVNKITFEGIELAQLNHAALNIIEQGLKAVVICPSNPFLSIDPILSLGGFVDAVKKQGCPVIAVSNIIDGAATKGPAAKLMGELGIPRSALGVARYYQDRYPGLLTHFVLDEKDQNGDWNSRSNATKLLCRRERYDS